MVSKYSTIIDGDVKSWRVIKMSHNDFEYLFYAGDVLLGRLYKMNRARWDAFSEANINTSPRIVRGFKSQLDAKVYLVECFRQPNKE